MIFTTGEVMKNVTIDPNIVGFVIDAKKTEGVWFQRYTWIYKDGKREVEQWERGLQFDSIYSDMHEKKDLA
jgi:hypothetical protein